MRTAPPRTQTVIGGLLGDYLSALRDIAPKDNPRGRWLADFFLEGPEEMAARMAAGDRYAVIDPRPNSRLVNPQLLETIGVFPAATAVKTPQAFIAPAVSAGVGLLGKAARVPSGEAPSLWEAIAPGMVDPRVGLLSQVGYHGTPHRFPPTEKNPLGEFDLAKIGTGEGAQEFGHGIYVAENPATAKYYIADRSYVGRVMQGKPSGLKHDAEWIAQTAVDEHGDAALNHLQNVLKQSSYSKNPKQIESNKKLQEAINLVEKGDIERQGSLYEVDIPDEIIDNQMLDWDKPLSQQNAKVKTQLKNAVEEMTVDDAINMGFDPFDYGNNEQKAIELAKKAMIGDEATTTNFLNNWAILRGTEAAGEELLNKHGIKGIKYKDQLSRGKEGGTRNFVLFDPTVATITGRN